MTVRDEWLYTLDRYVAKRAADVRRLAARCADHPDSIVDRDLLSHAQATLDEWTARRDAARAEPAAQACPPGDLAEQMTAFVAAALAPPVPQEEQTVTKAARPYQLAAIAEARAHVQSGKRSILFVLPTGAGKTYTAGEVCRLHVAAGGRVLWLAHRAELVDQAATALTTAGLAVGVIAAQSKHRPQPHARVQVASTQTLLARGTDFEPTLMVLDECVTGDTDVGGKRADEVRVGDYVDSWGGARVARRRVTHVFVNRASTLRTLRVGARSLTVTDAHPIWVEGKGYVHASQVGIGDMCCVRLSDEALPQGSNTDDLLVGMQEGMAETCADALRGLRGTHLVDRWPGLAKDVLARMPQRAPGGDDSEDESGARGRAHAPAQPDALPRDAREDVGDVAIDRALPVGARRQWAAAVGTATDASRGTRHGVGRRMRGADACRPWDGLPELLQDRRCAPGAKGGDRSGRALSPLNSCEGARREEDGATHLARVDSIEVHESGRDGTFGGRARGGLVYNFEVEGEHNFFANGVLTHNCHHYPSAEWQKVITRYPHALRIGLTATPERQDGLGLGGLFDCIVVGATIAQLTELGHLVPLEVVAPDRVLPSKEIAQRPVDAWTQHAGGQQAVVFAPHVAAANEFAAEFRLAGVPAGVVTGDLATGDRMRVLDDYARGRIKVLCNVAVLTEGWDHPPTGVCILARGCGSPGLYIQITGRVLRPHPGKTRALLIDLRGVVHIHGRPDEDRVYSLEGKGIRRATADMGPERFCPVCKELMDPGSTVCAMCGREREGLKAPSVTGDVLRTYARDRLRGDSAERQVERLAKWMQEAADKEHKPGAALHRFKACYSRWATPAEQRAAERLNRGAA